MNAMIEWRNQRAQWEGQVTFIRLRLRNAPTCEDCVVATHACGGTGALAKARWRRRVETSGAVTLLCDAHKRAWESWTPGQLDLLAEVDG